MNTKTFLKKKFMKKKISVRSDSKPNQNKNQIIIN
jgi:hypothetical protein